jgi:type I restriction enzyme S subunit
VGILRLLTNDLIYKFVYYHLVWQRSRLEFDYVKKAHPSVIKDLYEIAFPPLPIQQKIVKILDTIQSAVEIQEKIIEKTKELKKSLMAELFKYGAPSFRNPEPEQARYGARGRNLKKTEIGEIPEDWEVVRVGEVVIEMKAGGTPNTSEEKYWGGDIAFTLIEDLVNAGKFLVKTNASITKLGLKNSSSWVVPENSIILSLYATVGKPVINKIPVAITQNMIGIIPNKEIIDLEFLYYALENVRNKLWKYTDLSVHRHITTSEAKKILIPLPSLSEQQEIAEILQTID